MAWWIYLVGAVILYVLAGLRVVTEYERGVKFTLGKFTGVMSPGLRIVLPIIQTWERVDMRVKAVDVPDQDCITRDNISVNVNAVVYYRVGDSSKAIIKVEDYNYAISQLAQTTMRNMVGEVDLDQLLTERDKISEQIRKIVDQASDPWGIEVSNLDLKDMQLPTEMKRVMSKQAEAEREKRAVIIKAEGEVTAAANLSKAATMLSHAPGALHLRTLGTINDLSSEQSNTVIFTVPLEVLQSFTGYAKKKA